MITEYFVCSGKSTQHLQDTVNQGIRDGWQPLGGVGVNVTREYWVLYQAVVRITTDKS
jgi:hypothetical protein